MLKTPSGNPDSIKSSPMRTADSGTFSEGFKTNVLPQTIAIGNIQSGTIAGKLNGVMPAHTPTGWRIVSQSTWRAMLASDWPMIRLGTPQANSTTSTPRWTDARDSAKRLAVLARDQVRQLLGVGGQLFAKPEHDARPFDDRRLGPGGQGPRGRLHGPIDLVAVQNGTWAMMLPFDGLKTGPDRLDRLATQWPPMSMVTGAGASRSASVVVIERFSVEGVRTAS